MIKNHKILLFSACFFILPFLYLILFVENSNAYERYLSTIMLINFIFSILFWHNPIKNSIIHKLDRFFVILALIYGTIYISIIKSITIEYKYFFLILFFIFIFLHKLSNKYSTKKWCSKKHIFYHFLMHIVGISASYIAFI